MHSFSWRPRKDDGVVLVWKQWTQNPGEPVFQCESKGQKIPVSQLKAAGKEDSLPSLGSVSLSLSVQVASWWGLSKSGRARCTTQSIHSNVNLIQKQTHTYTEYGLTKYLDSSLSQASRHITLTITVSKGGMIPPGHTATAPLNPSWDYSCLDATWFCICWSKWVTLITRKT